MLARVECEHARSARHRLERTTQALEPRLELEVHRPAVGKPLLHAEDPRVVAVASDQPLDGVPLPVIDLNDTDAVADFVVAHCGLG